MVCCACSPLTSIFLSRPYAIDIADSVSRYRNDILRKHGIIPEKPPSPTPIIEEAILKSQALAHDNRLEDKDLDDLHELEELEDDAFLEQYRQQRITELAELSKKSIHGQVYPLQKPDYNRDVTEASKTGPVLVNLTSELGNKNVESRVLSQLWGDLARRFGDVKFCEMRAGLAIEGYPEKNTPTILVYKDGEILRQVVTLVEMRGPKTGVEDLVNLLIELKIIKDNDQRVIQLRKEQEARREEVGQGKSGKQLDEENDDDWD
jgi:hypothetical protein